MVPSFYKLLLIKTKWVVEVRGNFRTHLLISVVKLHEMSNFKPSSPGRWMTPLSDIYIIYNIYWPKVSFYESDTDKSIVSHHLPLYFHQVIIWHHGFVRCVSASNLPPSKPSSLPVEWKQNAARAAASGRICSHKQLFPVWRIRNNQPAGSKEVPAVPRVYWAEPTNPIRQLGPALP